MSFHKKLLDWYKENRRPFPWRENTKPYNVWLSEIILQQTRAAQGLPYYESFISNFPTVEQLAAAKEDHVMKLWQGLGYYSRARNLHATAKTITHQYHGRFPNDFNQIKSLKGIGDYTASAIASICFGQEQAVVDGNVYRVLSRIFGMDQPIDASGAHKIFKEKAQNLIKGAAPGDFNQAMMEFGALQCVPKNPNCQDCIFKNQCIAFQQAKVGLLPVKANKVKVKNRYLHFFVLIDESKNTLLQKREGNGIWQNLYQFPLIETFAKQKHYQQGQLKSLLAEHQITSDFVIDKWNDEPIFHKLTHQHLEINFWIVKLSESTNLDTQSSQIQDYPMPKVLQNFRDKFFIN
ncbi:MAG: A/G-specific adenine glycosylase [Flavobacteriaceae bacterium]|jgi:A/G-specific adenine glycosylase